MGLLSDVLPADVVAVEQFSYKWDRMFPEELASVANSVRKRQEEYLTARTCAREALRVLGFPDRPIPTGPRGTPGWPPGAVGSITHCSGYIAAAVSKSNLYAALGVDAELNAPMRPAVLEMISCSSERLWIKSLEKSLPGLSGDRLLFSIKETTYKTLFPLFRLEFDFHDVVVTLADTRWSAQVEIPRSTASGGQSVLLHGRWSAADGFIAAVATVAKGPTLLRPSRC